MTDTLTLDSNAQRSLTANAVAEFLATTAAYAEHPAHVERAETHISWVFLTDRFAYKQKKPVRFDFLDFSTPELRYEACQQEVILNRRLARDVYLGVLPVNAVPHGLQLGGEGTPVDWVVKMWRLPADRALDRVIAAEQLTRHDVAKIAATLVNFYDRLPPLSTLTANYLSSLEKHVLGNRQELLAPRHHLSSSTVKRVHTAQLRALRTMPDLFASRVLDGRIVDGHGDLRPEHIYLTGTPTIIDCIEFNAEFRQLDVADELCFLAMECAALDAEWVGDTVIDHYRNTSGDVLSDRLLSFYKTYRACVRAKVSALRAQQLRNGRQDEDAEPAERYLALADRFAAELGRPLTLVVRGLSGTGKSTLATNLADAMGMEQLSTDRIRRELFGASSHRSAYNAGIYTAENRSRVYDELLRRAGLMLAGGLSVVLDGTFLTQRSRIAVKEVAEQHGADSLVIECRCPDAVAIERIRQRGINGHSHSDSRPDVFEQQRQDEKLEESNVGDYIIDTTESIGETINTIYGHVADTANRTVSEKRCLDLSFAE